MAASSRSRRAASARPPSRSPGEHANGPRRAVRDPDGGTGGVHDLLIAAVQEAARLLDADGAMVYLVDPATGRLRFAHDAGIKSRRSRDWVRSIELEPGVGMFGHAVANRSVVVTSDYPNDRSFRHADAPDRVVDDIGIHSMVVAPLVSGDEVFGAFGTFSNRPDAFDDAQIALVRSLADHAAAAMANARLIEQLDRSRAELAERAEIERSLREIAARISAANDLPGVLQRAVDEAARLMRADGARIDLIDEPSGRLRWAYASGALRPDPSVWPDDPDEALDRGVSGQAVMTGRPYWTGDYVGDERFPHSAGADGYIESMGIRSVMAAPLIGEGGPFGALTVFTGRADAWGDEDAGLLEAIADQAALTITTARLIDELGRSRSDLSRRAEAEQALRELAGRITAMRDPAEILQEVVELATRLVRGDGAILDLLEPGTTNLRWAYDDGIGRQFTDQERAQLWISVGVGATGVAVAEDRVVVAGDDLADLFPPSPESTEFYERTGFRSMIAAPISGEDGPLGVIEVYSRQPDAFVAADADLIRALAGQAAIAITNARLITELAESRSDLARTAEAERTLREIAAQVSAMRDQDEIMQAVVDAAVRLLRATGSMIDLVDVGDVGGAWTYRQTEGSVASSTALLDEVALEPDAGVSGLAIANRRVERSGRYLDDERFTHTPERDAFVRDAGIESVIAAPLLQRGAVLGAITVYVDRPDAFDDTDAAVLAGLADQAAVAIANVNLIAELEHSRAEIAKRADAERTLREIAARVTAILDPAEVLQRIVDEAARLLESDGSRIDLYDPTIDALRWSYAAGETMARIPAWATTSGLKPNQAVAGTAFAEQRPIRTDDYLADERFVKDDDATAFVRETGIRSVVAVPLAGDTGPLGTLSVVSRRPAAYDEGDGEVLAALATQASIAITNANLMTQLASSRAEVERRAEAERALREIGARITAIREPGDVLQPVVDAAHRLLRADGAVIDEFDPDSGTLRYAYDSGLPEKTRKALRLANLRVGEGVAGKALAEGRVIVIGDYRTADFKHEALADSLADVAGIRDLIVAPIIGDSGPLGAIEVFSHQPDAFGESDAAVLGGLAEQAAIAITNARLIEELERSQRDLARRAETERSLRDITARIAALRDPDEILSRVVEEAKRLLETDGAHLTRMADSSEFLVPVVVSGARDERTRDWLLSMEFPLGGGINGLAAAEGRPIWTFDYRIDPRIPHEPDDIDVAERLGLRGMAAAPLRAPGGEVIGTLAVSTGQPRTFEPDELDLLQGLADQAAIALTNSNLVEQLSRSESRFRGLVQTTPDVIWRADPDGYFTFMADSGEALFGRPTDEIVGKHFQFLTDPDSMARAVDRYRAVGRTPELVERVPLVLTRRDGSTFHAEVTTTGVFEDGRWVGNQGTVRDVSERVRLERELRQSEERYRYLVQNAPDIVWSIDADARLTFISDAAERLTGFRPDQLLGRHFGAIVHESSRDVAEIDWRLAMDDTPQQELRGRLNLLHRDGSAVPAEFIAVASLDAEGRFAGANGSVRDMRAQDRLERELRESEDRYRTLASSSPDLVFATDAEGYYSFLSDRAATMLGWDLETAVGKHYLEFIAPGWEDLALRTYQSIVADPTAVRSLRIDFVRGDGSPIPLEVNVVGTIEDGHLSAIHGVARDVSERERLQGELQRSEERYRFLVQNSPDVVFSTDPDGKFRFLSDAIERLTGYAPEEVVGLHFSALVDASTLPVAAERWASLVADPANEAQAALVLVGKDGRRTPVDVRARGIVVDGRFDGIQGAVRDVSERARLEGELRRQAGELAASEERAHLARELHDSVTQALFSMTLVARSIELQLERDPAAAREQLGQLRELQREALAEMRALIFELRPGNLEQDGLVRALKTHSAALQGRIGLPIVVESDLEGRLPLPVEEALYRIAQEALHNVVKHAAARQVRLDLRHRPDGLQLRITDDGRGFDPAAVPDGHLGLAGMRARAERLGAAFGCSSRPGEGTTVEVSVPEAALSADVHPGLTVDPATLASVSIRDI